MPPPQDNARFLFLIILILWLNAGNDSAANLLSASSLVTARLQGQRSAYEAMTRSHWGDFAPGHPAAAAVAAANATGRRWLNMIGFREEDGLAWDDLDTFRQRCLEWSRSAYPTVHGQSLWDAGQTLLTWQNATGTVRGPWVRQPASVRRDPTSYNLSASGAAYARSGGGWSTLGHGQVGAGRGSEANGTSVRARSTDAEGEGAGEDAAAAAAAVADDAQKEDKSGEDAPPVWHRGGHAAEWGRNVTGASGKLLVRLFDETDEEAVPDSRGGPGEPRSGGLVRAASALVTIEDTEGTGSSHDMRLYGVHWPRQGALLLTTTSDKFAGIFGLPHLAPAADFFHSSLRLLNRTLDAGLRSREASRLFGGGSSSSDSGDGDGKDGGDRESGDGGGGGGGGVGGLVNPSLSTPLWSSSVDGAPEGLNPAPRCEYVMYVQIHPLDASQFLSVPPSSDKTKRGAVADNASVPLDSRGLPAAPSYYDYSQEDMTQIMLAIEREMRFPTGAPIFGRRGVPEMQMSAVLYSPDCAYFLETQGPPRFAAAEGQHLRGLKAETFAHEARLWMLALAAVLFGQVRLLLGQVRESYTPSTLGRVSFLTMAAMLLADGLVFAAASTWTLVASASYLPSLVVMLVAFIAMLVGGSFLSEVYNAQEPERRRHERAQQARRQAQLQARQQAQEAAEQRAREHAREHAQQAQQQVRDQLRQHYAPAATATTPATATPTTATPTTATARAPSPPIIVPSDQDIDAEIAENAAAAAGSPVLPAPVTAAGPRGTGANGGTPAAATAAAAATAGQPFSNIAGRMVMTGVVLMFLSLAATTWWASVRALYANALGFVYLSMWVPQIVRNIERNSRRAFSWRFMIGQSVLRLLPLAYFYLRADNVLFAQTDGRTFACLAGWLWIQLWVLALQDVLGPRYGIPSGWAPEAWEYHPVLREDHVEAGGLPIGLVSTAPAPAGDNSGPGAGAGAGAGAGPGPASPVAVSGPRRRLSSSGVSAPHHDAGAGMAANTTIWTMDCAICCETLDVPVVRAGADDLTVRGLAGVLARRQYMVTPCRHIFHTECLEGWLRFRLQCPICREELPPL